MARYLMTTKGVLRDRTTDAARVAIGAGAGLVVLLVLALPTMWIFFARMPDRSLSRLSNIGQAYGVLAAIIAALALAAVTVALAIQIRQSKESRIQQWRDAHADIVNMVIDRPDLYGPCMMDMAQYESEDECRQYLWTTKYLIYAKIGMETGDVPEKAVREEICAGMFASPTARRLWVKRRDRIIATFGNLGYFYSVIEEEYQRAVVTSHDRSVPVPHAPNGMAPRETGKDVV